MEHGIRSISPRPKVTREHKLNIGFGRRSRARILISVNVYSFFAFVSVVVCVNKLLAWFENYGSRGVKKMSLCGQSNALLTN